MVPDMGITISGIFVYTELISRSQSCYVVPSWPRSPPRLLLWLASFVLRFKNRCTKKSTLLVTTMTC